MAKTQKKTGKGRLDKHYKLANFLESARCCINPCATPGGWLQVASKTMPLNALIVVVDLVPIRPIPRVVTFAQDITTSDCRAQLRSELKDWKADVVLHDGAPNVGTAWIQDAYSQSELVLMSLKLAVEFLAPGGTFVTKVFRSVDYNNLIWVFSQLFGKVETTKPPSSRNVSAEIFVVCQGFLAPQQIDPKFLDHKHVFKDLSALPLVPSTSTVQPRSKAHNNVFMPENKRRAREGFADGDYTLFHALPAAEFVRAHDAVLVLGTANQITFKSEWLKLEATTPDVIANCEDLKVLGKGDFKKLLKWRTAIREELGLESKQKPLDDAEETVEVMEVDEDQQIEAELTRLNAGAAARAKRDRRKANEKRTRTVMRMQLQMTAALDIGMEFTDNALKGDVFDLSGVDGKGVTAKNDGSSDEGGEQRLAGGGDEGESSGEDGEKKVAALEDELDGLYEQYRERMAERDLKFKAMESRQKDKSREEWSGIRKGDDEDEEESGEESGEGGWDVAQAAKDQGDEGEGSSDEDEGERPAAKRRKVGDENEKERLITRLEEPKLKGAASKAAQVWFSQDLFKDVANIEDEDEEGDIHEDVEMASESDGVDEPESAEGEEEEDDFEILPQEADKTPMWDVDNVDEEEAKQEYIKRLLLSWFLDDERKHYKPNLPITKEAVAALRAKQRALDARPITKVAEAKARKKLRAQQRLEKAMSKAEGVVATDDMAEKEKAAQIEKVMRKGMASAGRKRKEVKVVVAKGVNKGVKGRPKGVKGRYAMVVARMRKEVRAKKRKEKASKKRRKNSLLLLIKLDELWRIRKDAHWEIVAPSNKRDQVDVPPNPAARSRPAIWSENLYDAQDALTYFSVGQTILTSKVPRVHARSVLLTKNLHTINADWRSGQITFSLHLKYRIDFARPRNWRAPDLTHGFELLEGNRKPPDPLQFRKLMACRDTGVPVKLLASGDFPSLPVVDSEIKLDDGTSLKIRSDKWRNGLVVLGFFWVKKVEEDVDKHVFAGELDIDNDCENESGRDDSDDLNTPAKRPRFDPDERHRGDEMDIDRDSDVDKMGSAIYVQPEFQGDFCCGASQQHAPLIIDPSIPHETIQPPPNPNTTSSQLAQAEADPETLGLVLEPKDWPDIKAVRPPQIRASLLLGWHCKTCGKLNPRIKWDKTQECPLCKAKTEILFPEWRRKAHAEAAGPIGTLHRLDDGGHSHKTGLHALASRDPDSGMTCVEYWLADPPLPILAGLGRTALAARTRRGGLAAQPAPRA
ncbi:AdoMet-dependent rRNA methyltransferase spb1, partial [Ceratobasidium sp. 370]